ncbi:alpha-2-macroglobulin family protein [Pseudaestuariivita rosea]|uniref:alpha-2-macroglobulin family protein n=1 Tax=Pseudaestuariivita rosea TaxID=2763263 RepID=UPI001ABB7270|nr:alpha-2-macroglobulin family protein [Pseudaestuariivita rosea]
MRILAIIFCFLAITSAWAENLVPEKYVSVTPDTDFAGNDIRQIFDTTFDACRQACLADNSCVAFTFNSVSNSCFPKSQVTASEPYQGAISAQVRQVEPGILANVEARVNELGFLSRGDFTRARALANDMASSYPVGDRSLTELMAQQNLYRLRGEKLGAARAVGAAITLTDRSDLWAEYARVIVDLRVNNRTYIGTARSAGINAYMRAEDDARRSDALIILAEALIKSDRGRTAIEALKLAQDIRPNDDTERRLQDAVERYGFRIVEHQVESDLANPKVCARFSEPLETIGVDYEPFVNLDGADLAVEAQRDRLCLEGLRHGDTQTVVFRRGLPAKSGLILERDISLEFYVGDRSPVVRFPGRAYVLPKTADVTLPVETVNIEQIDLRLHQVSDRNLIRAFQQRYFEGQMYGWSLDQFTSEIGPVVWQGTGDVPLEMNQDMTTQLPMAEALQGQVPGVYVLQARVPGESVYENGAAMQWFVVTDLGVSTMSGTDGLHVFVRGLGDAQAKEDTKITLISRANAVLGEVTTDADGYAVFDAALARGTGGAAPAMVTAELGDDMTFLSLIDPAFDLSDRGVEGRQPAPPIDVFLTTDRGIYRAGDTVHATVLARDPQIRGLQDVPMTAILTRADGVEYTRQTSANGVAGGHVFSFDIGAAVPRGSWRLDIKADPKGYTLASTAVLVEDFIPDRIEFDLTIEEEKLAPGDKMNLTVEADYLFGAPAGDLPVRGELRLIPRTTLAEFPGFSFGRYDQRVSTQTNALPSEQRTSADGTTTIEATIPAAEITNRPYRLQANVRVLEGSGRPVERSLTHDLSPAGSLIGIKPLFEYGEIGENSTAGFEIISINSDLQPEPMDLQWTVNRVTTRYQWYRQNGRWNWEPITERRSVAAGKIQTGADPVQIEAPVTWGRYEIVVERPDGTYLSSSSSFYAGWYVPADTSTTPDMLELSLDRPDYAIGDTATLRMVPRMAGTALVTVMSNRLITMETVQVAEGENLIQLPVTEEWGAGAYVTATVVRPMDVAAKRNPTRALGLSYAKVDPGDKALQVALDMPEKIEPRGPLTISLQVDGVRAGDTAYATIAAVDVGILNVTRFESPDPSDHYFGQRRLGMEIRDIYGRLIDGLNGAQGQIRSGGDGGSADQRTSPPPNEELVTFFSGPVTIGPDGTAQVTFDVPDFNGTLRAMAVVWSETGVGQADAEILVRDPVVVTASLPRFLSPGDTSRLLLEIVHTEGRAGDMPLRVTSNGLALDMSDVPQAVTVAEQEKVKLNVPIRADEVGVYQVDIALTLPDGRELTKALTLGVQINDPPVGRTSRFTLAAGDTFTFDDNVFAGLHPGTGSSSIAIGPIAQFDTPGLLQMLDQYPYGCTEQTTSRAMPLLYLSEVAEAMGLAHRSQVNERVDQAIERVLSRQSSSGSFGLWRVGSGDLWLDAYVTDFLSRANAQGFDVPERGFRMAVNNLKNRVNYEGQFDTGGESFAYAMMVLAREGEAAMADLRYYADIKGRDFSTPLAAAQIGAALAMYGDQQRADRMFSIATEKMQYVWRQAPNNTWRLDYGTRLRDAAGLLALATESGSTAINRDALVDRVSASSGRMSTQEATWSLLAARSLVRDGGAPDFLIDGAPVDGPMVRLLQDTPDAAPIRLQNNSNRDEVITMTTYGVPSEPEPAGGNGYQIARSYYDMEGVRLSPSEVSVGDRMVVVIEVDPFGSSDARLMIDDPLPAGFEIDNPRLLQGGQIRGFDWLKPVYARHSEFRSDRFLAAVDWRKSDSFRLAYIVRAVSPGTFHHPAAIVEDMYRPQLRARTDTGQVVITE